MTKTYEAIGTTEDGTTIVLKTPLPIRGQVKVQVCTETAEEVAPRADREAVLKAIHERQRARGHVPMTPTEVEEHIRQLREEEDEAQGLP